MFVRTSLDDARCRGIFTCEPLQDIHFMLNSTWRSFTDVSSSNTSTLVSSVGMPPLVQAQQWFGVAMDPTVWGGRVEYGRTP